MSYLGASLRLWNLRLSNKGTCPQSHHSVRGKIQTSVGLPLFSLFRAFKGL